MCNPKTPISHTLGCYVAHQGMLTPPEMSAHDATKMALDDTQSINAVLEDELLERTQLLSWATSGVSIPSLMWGVSIP